MSTKQDREPSDLMRKSPQQRRSRATVNFILDATAQILSANGDAEVTTAAIAEKTGVSIGTVYQYFGDRDAILRALADRERRQHLAFLRSLFAQDKATRPQDPVRTFVRSLIRSVRAREGATQHFSLLATAAMQRDGSWRRDEFVNLVLSHWLRTRPDVDQTTLRVRAFVMTQAVIGALHAAAVAHPPCLDDAAFEDALCDLIGGLW